MDDTKIAVVVPTCRPERLAEWYGAWRDELKGCALYIIHDAPSVPPGPIVPVGFECAWDSIDRDLGADSWIIPRRSDCIRSYGFLKAYLAGADFIMTLDDDCLPCPPDLPWGSIHRRNLENAASSGAWLSTLESAWPRGFPYQHFSRELPCALSHGLWRGVPDLDAPTQLSWMRTAPEFRNRDRSIPLGKYFPMCGMNLAFRREIAPAMYFLLMGWVAPGERSTSTGPRFGAAGRPLSDSRKGADEDAMTLEPLPFDRFGDIWAGILAKKICDYLGLGVHSGAPHILHSRASDPFVNLINEAPGIRENENFWTRVDAVRLHGDDAAYCYLEIAGAMKEWGGEHADYWSMLSEAMRIWIRLLTPAAPAR